MVSTEVTAPYSDAHIAAYPVEYIAGIDLYNVGEFHAQTDPNKVDDGKISSPTAESSGRQSQKRLQ
jgi:hypothetical protein